MLRNKVEEKVKKKETSFLRKLKESCPLAWGCCLKEPAKRRSEALQKILHYRIILVQVV